ncbi:hypothetical protein BHE74_00004766 [Ensete ventricosum]|nr:hypothetical protein GW17_00025985 [Ensete ventricosum]RWW86458.1 hypothetical protein BHE74_00004766 [Ensete ventricosum]RZR83220.1 hypothetical protein BHM03_00009809 [Ensete ventricosum]
MADVWSCGVTLYVMLVGAYPFEDADDPKNFRKTMAVPVASRITESVFVQRITVREIRNHPWFLKNLPRGLTEVAQALYYKRDASGLAYYSLQSEEETMKIVEEARIPPAASTPLTAGSGWAKEDEQEEGKQEKRETEEGEEEDEYEYDKRVKEVHSSGKFPIIC